MRRTITVLAVAMFAVAGCGSPARQEAAGWSYRDDRGVTVTAERRPVRIVAQVSAAGALQDFGVRAVADRFVEIRFDPWYDGAAPTEKQMALVGTVLGSGPLS